MGYNLCFKITFQTTKPPDQRFKQGKRRCRAGKNDIQSPFISQTPSYALKTTSQRIQPSGTKRKVDNAKQVIEFLNEDEAIKKVAQKVPKACQITEEMLNLDKEKSIITLFSMTGAHDGIKSNSVNREK